MGLSETVKSLVDILKPNSNQPVQGQNPNINFWYKVWQGNADWLRYNYLLPNGNKQEATMLTLNMPRFLARQWANNFANEDTTITIPNEAANERLQDILANNNLFGRFNSFSEMFFALGIGAISVEFDIEAEKETSLIKKAIGDIKLKIVSGRRVIPITVEDGEVTEVAFVSYGTGTIKITIHYLSEDDNTYHIATFNGTNSGGTIVMDLYNWYDIPTTATKDTPLFVCFKPNLSEDDDPDNEVGVSIFSTAMDTFKHLDLGYTAFYKEIKLGQKVKFLSTDTIQFTEDADGNRVEVLPFDESDESILFVKDANEKGAYMQEFNGEFRIDALTKYINTNLNCAAMLCGLGQTQFEFDGGAGRPIQTATGVIAKQTELYRNVIKQENMATACFRKLVMAIAHINNTFFTDKPKIDVKKSDIQVLYDDNIVEDTASKKQAELNEVNSGVMSIAEFRSHWYDEDLDTAKQFVFDSGLLLDKYTLALQSNVITPEIFVDLVFGENYKHKNELVAYITENYATKETDLTGFEDEENIETEQEEENQENEDGADA